MNEWSRLVRVTEPAAPVVTLQEMRRWSRVDFGDDDVQLQMLVDVATAAIDGPNGAGIALSPQTWRLSLDHFPCEIVVPLGPVTEILSIAYTAEDGETATVPTWRADLDSQPARILPARGTSWPAVVCEPGAVKVTFRCGFEKTPADLKAAICLLAAHYYEHREAVTTDLRAMELPMGVASIIERYRVGRFA